MMKTLADAISLAAHAHEGQRDKAGKPYILHPLRLMLKMRTEREMMAAVLHDIVEDTPVTLDDLRRQGYPEEVVQAVDCLTRREGETYEEFIARIKPNALARGVKIADLEDNLAAARIAHPTEKDLARMERYRRALVELKARF
jgi:(p)ppGpp synthase/HD superfamily hydrolase